MNSKLPPSLASCGLCLLFVLVAAVAAFLASRITEAKTPAIRQWMLKITSERPISSP